jgi:radical SAM superfamily enzyme YgiQ (UPF0313 family)
MKIALVKPPWWVRYCPPYILAFFAAVLRGRGHEVSCFDLNNTMYHPAAPGYKKYWDDRDYYSTWENESFVKELSANIDLPRFADEVMAGNPRVVCFDTHTPSVLVSYEFARLLKERNKDVITLFMGHKASRAQMAFDFARNPHVDYVCPGEADAALPQLMEKIERLKPGEPLPLHKGFLLKRGGEVLDGGHPDLVEDLDALPIPDYSDFKADIDNATYMQPHRLDVLESRGCVNACHFCYDRVFWQRHRAMSAARVYKELSTLVARHPSVNYFYFNGLLLNGRLEMLSELCDLVLANGLKIKWAGQAAVRPGMTKELMNKMAKAGCVWLGFGIESGSQKVLNSMNKSFPISYAEQVLKDTHEAGIGIQINLMFGLPTETEQDFQETLTLFKKVRPYIDTVLASQSYFTLENATYVKKNPEKFGINKDGHHLFWESDGGKNNYLERQRRYEEFCRLALELKIPETSGVLSVKPDKWFLMGQYYRHEKNPRKAAECFELSLKHESDNPDTRRLLQECLAAIPAEAGAGRT